MIAPMGASIADGKTHFRVRSPNASQLWLCLFDGNAETRHAMLKAGNDWQLTLDGELAGTRYGYRANGDYAPAQGHWFDPAKLLVDPYAMVLDQRFIQHPDLAHYGADTAAIIPKAIVQQPLPEALPQAPIFTHGGLIYELNVKSFTQLHPGVPARYRGTIAALAQPCVIDHLKKLRANAVELMPIIAWLDERHLQPLGLRNAWGYNPVAMMALDPGLCPGGIAELRDTVASLRQAGIGVILDLVFNHTGESDASGGTLSLRGLDNASYAHDAAPVSDGQLINDSGCGNTLDFAQPSVRTLALATMEHFVRHAGVDGFRFDLAPIMARGPGFASGAPIFTEISANPWLTDRVMIAEPWDIGPGGYQLGNFPAGWLEWNDRFRDDIRQFWRGDGSFASLATRMAGSADIFGEQSCRSVNFLAAHDGFTLADTVSYQQRHNWANGEDNRDGHGENFSWNCGIEGAADDGEVIARRAANQRAMLATLFASTGSVMLTAGDEFGRSQQGNNNAYAQDNAMSWIDWSARDVALEDYVAGLAGKRASALPSYGQFPLDGEWLRLDGAPMTAADWHDPNLPGIRYQSPTRSFTINRSGTSAALD